jgi:hypothetical protein
MIAVSRDRSGFVKVDWSADRRFPKEEGLSEELAAGLFVEKIAPNYLLIDDGGQLVPVIEYISVLLMGQGFEVEIDQELLGKSIESGPKIRWYKAFDNTRQKLFSRSYQPLHESFSPINRAESDTHFRSPMRQIFLCQEAARLQSP